MGKRLTSTPRSVVKSALRQLWLRSRERTAAIKRDQYTCQRCHVKRSKAKGKEQAVEVHHLDGVLNWDMILNMIYEQLLCSPDKLETLCPECHEREAVCNLAERILRISRADNGYVCTWDDTTVEGDRIERIMLFAEHDGEWGSVECFRELLYFITEHFAMAGTKHDARRITITTDIGENQ